MSEPRKNHLNIDGGQVKEDDHVATYKPLPEAETEFRSSKANLSKSKEKVSADGAEEKLLPKEEEAKIVTRVDMADAKYVVGDHRNGDAKIELDANKRQFSGISKEELLKYADDPFWVNLRWFLFVVFWAMWLAMLAGAIVIIVQTPKCPPPVPKTWFEMGPLIDLEEVAISEVKLDKLKESSVRGVFIDAPTYDILDEKTSLDRYKEFFNKAKEYGIKVIVDLIPNYVSIEHEWFKRSEARQAGYEDYFVWRAGKEFGPDGATPNNWVSTLDQPAWSYNTNRSEFYLHQFAENQPDLNFRSTAVKAHFEKVLDMWMGAGAAGVRLNKVRQLLVDESFANEEPAPVREAASSGHTQYAFYRHSRTSDQPELFPLLAAWGQRVRAAAAAVGNDDAVFTVLETAVPELWRLERNVSALRPPAAAALFVRDDAAALAAELNGKLGQWPVLQLVAPDDMEVAAFALLLPAAPVLTLRQLGENDNASSTESLAHVVKLREDASIQHGNYSIQAVTTFNSSEPKLLACARWKAGNTGYLAVLNPGDEPQYANLTTLPLVPAELAIYHKSHAVNQHANYSSNQEADNVLVPARSTLVLNYVPHSKN